MSICGKGPMCKKLNSTIPLGFRLFGLFQMEKSKWQEVSVSSSKLSMSISNRNKVAITFQNVKTLASEREISSDFQLQNSVKKKGTPPPSQL